MTLGIMTLGIMTLGIMTLGIMSFKAEYRLCKTYFIVLMMRYSNGSTQATTTNITGYDVICKLRIKKF